MRKRRKSRVSAIPHKWIKDIEKSEYLAELAKRLEIKGDVDLWRLTGEY
jgi:hypothetical protein